MSAGLQPSTQLQSHHCQLGNPHRLLFRGTGSRVNGLCFNGARAVRGVPRLTEIGLRIAISVQSLFYRQQQLPSFCRPFMGAGRVSALVEERALAMASGEAGNTQIVMLGLRNRSRAATEWNNDTVKLKRSTSSSAISCASSCSRRCAPTRHLETSQPLKMSSCWRRSLAVGRDR
jgi:hypothetical protein